MSKYLIKGASLYGEKVADILIGELREDSPLEADNAPRQKVVRTEAKKF